MSINVNFAGTTYAIPEVSDAYGTDLTNFLVAVGQKASVTTRQVVSTQLIAGASYTFTPTDTIIVFSSATAAAQLLPGEVGRLVGVFIDNPSVDSVLTITPSVGQTINGVNPLLLYGPYPGAYLIFNGVEWTVVSELNKVQTNRAFASQPTNTSFLEGGITPFGPEQTVANLQSASVTLADFQFAKIFIEGKNNFIAELSVDLISGKYSVLSDPSDIILTSDAGAGLVVTVSGLVVTFKNRFNSPVNIRIGILGPRILSQTVWS